MPAPLTCDYVVDEGGGHAEDAHQHVADGQVEYEDVGDRAHVPTAQHDEAHDAVAHHAQQEDEQVGHGEHGGDGGLVQVEFHVGDVDRALLRGPAFRDAERGVGAVWTRAVSHHDGFFSGREREKNREVKEREDEDKKRKRKFFN